MTTTLVNPQEVTNGTYGGYINLENLITLDEAKQRLAPTEGLTEYEFATDGDTNKLKFDFPDNWNAGLADADEFHVTPASIDIDGTQIPLTKNGALELASTIGLQKSYVERTPGSFIGPQLDYHYANGANGKKSLKILASDVGALAITRGTIQPFSGSRLLDAVVAGIQSKFGTDEVSIDYKWNHTLASTNMRVIVPSATRSIGSARAASAGDDPWSVGIEIANSIQGTSSLELSGYLFAWWCTNGCTVQKASSGRYRRKPSLTPDDAYDWARVVVDDVFNDLDREFDKIEHLTQIPLEGELNETVGRMFERFSVPADTRETIINNLVEFDDLTAYGLLNAVTAAGNNPDLSPSTVSALLRIGGDVADNLSERCETCHRF